MSTTTRLELALPLSTDAADISVINSNMQKIDNLVALKTEAQDAFDFSSSVSYSVEAQSGGKMFRKVGNTIFISYRSEATAISNNKVLFTLPSGYRPAVDIVAPAIFMSLAFGAVSISASDGKCTIIQNSSTVTTNVLLSVAFTIA